MKKEVIEVHLSLPVNVMADNNYSHILFAILSLYHKAIPTSVQREREKCFI